MDRQSVNELKDRVALLEYLQQQGWKVSGSRNREQVVGLCPFHVETHPSFWIHTRRNLFYCHGCGRGGDLLRFVELYHRLTFSAALAHLRAWLGTPALLAEVVRYYRSRLKRHPEAMDYLAWRGLRDVSLLEIFEIGYAPGGCLRAHLSGLGYGSEQLRAAGLINQKGADTFYRRMVFPCGENLYGRSLDAREPHRFLHGTKGGLYRWDRVSAGADSILVEGPFDVLALHQAGFENATCGWGTHLNRAQWEQLCAGERQIWIAFDGDAAGERAAAELRQGLRGANRPAACIRLPDGHDPASYFAAGAHADDFRALMEAAE